MLTGYAPGGLIEFIRVGMESRVLSCDRLEDMHVIHGFTCTTRQDIAKDNFHYVFERSEAGGLGTCPHERKKRGDAPLALRGPLPWRPVLFSDISTNAPSSPERKEKKRGAAVAV
jgi:hypothetical protein